MHRRRTTPLRRINSNTGNFFETPEAMAQHMKEQEELAVLKSKNSAMRRHLEKQRAYPWVSPSGRPSSSVKKTSALSQWAEKTGVTLAAAGAVEREMSARLTTTAAARPPTAAATPAASSEASRASGASGGSSAGSSARSPSVADSLRAEKVAATVALWQRSAHAPGGGGGAAGPATSSSARGTPAVRVSSPAVAPSPPLSGGAAAPPVRRELTFDGADLRISEEKRSVAERERDALAAKVVELERYAASVKRQALAEITKYRPTALSRFSAALAAWSGLLLLVLCLAREIPEDFVRDKAH